MSLLISARTWATCCASAMLLAVGLAAVPSAGADTAAFCGTSGSPRGYPALDRCSAGYHGAVGYTRFTLASWEGAEPICAIVKETATGGGANRSLPACAWAYQQESDCTTAYSPCSGYATDVNQSSTTGFYGYGFFSYSF
jgi:hypothetical protein